MRQVFSHVSVAIVGIAVGLFLQPGGGSITHDADDSINVLLDRSAASQHVSLSPIPIESEASEKPVERVNSVSSVSDPAQYLVDLLEEKTNSSDDATSGIRQLLANTRIEMINTGEIDSVVSDFEMWLTLSENPGKDVFDFLNAPGDDNEKHVLEWLISRGGALGTNHGLPESVVRELATASEADYGQWQEILGLIRIDTTVATNELFQTLTGISDPSLVATSLDAVQPTMLPPEQRSQVLSSLAFYAENDNDDVSSAAITALGSWAATDYIYLVESALTNGSDQVKRAALFAAADGTLRSTTLKHQMLSMLDDQSLPPRTRLDVFSALSYYSLNEEEYGDLYRFYESHVVPQHGAFNQN